MYISLFFFLSLFRFFLFSCSLPRRLNDIPIIPIVIPVYTYDTNYLYVAVVESRKNGKREREKRSYYGTIQLATYVHYQNTAQYIQ